jgi:D-glycero-D-manno-heptose 1,7-bisphosphate phosphatase
MPVSRKVPRLDPAARPRQAVIVAGGRGSRLGPLTELRPKPMIEVHGRPFLEYLIALLREQGFNEVWLLLGYLPDVVRDYFGDGRGFGLHIRYSITPAEALTVARLKAARSHLDRHFLLMYCDNYWPMVFEPMWRRFVASRAQAMVTVYANKDGYTSDTVKLGPGGYVEMFDRSRTAADLKGTEISYAILGRDLIDSLPSRDQLIEEALYPPLAARHELLANVTEHRYYSIGSPDRLSLTEIFLARRPAVILDRDGVLNRRAALGHYVVDVTGFVWLPGALEALRMLREAGYRVIVVTNQAGMARGDVTAEALESIHQTMRTQARAAGGAIDAIYHCPHDWYAGCECRKPRPGLLFQAQRDFALDLTRTYFLGDDERDMQAAAAAGAPGLLVTEDASLLIQTRRLISSSLLLHA